MTTHQNKRLKISDSPMQGFRCSNTNNKSTPTIKSQACRVHHLNSACVGRPPLAARIVSQILPPGCRSIITGPHPILVRSLSLHHPFSFSPSLQHPLKSHHPFCINRWLVVSSPSVSCPPASLMWTDVY